MGRSPPPILPFRRIKPPYDGEVWWTQGGGGLKKKKKGWSTAEKSADSKSTYKTAEKRGQWPALAVSGAGNDVGRDTGARQAEAIQRPQVPQRRRHRGAPCARGTGESEGRHAGDGVFAGLQTWWGTRWNAFPGSREGTNFPGRQNHGIARCQDGEDKEGGSQLTLGGQPSQLGKQVGTRPKQTARTPGGGCWLNGSECAPEGPRQVLERSSGGDLAWGYPRPWDV